VLPTDSTIMPPGSGFELPASGTSPGKVRPLVSALPGFIRSPALLTLVSAAVVFAISRQVADAWPRLVLGLTAELLLAVVLLQQGWRLLRHERRRAARESVAALTDDDPAPCFVTDAQGLVLSRNRAARRQGAETFAAVLGPEVADASALVAHLRDEALAFGSAQQDAVTRRNAWRLSARCLQGDTLVWRMDRRPGGSGEADRAPPTLNVGPDGSVLSANEAFRNLAGPPPAHLSTLVLDPPLSAGVVHRIPTPGGWVERLVAILDAPGGQQDVLLLPSGALATPAPAGEGWAALEGLPIALLRLSPAGLVLAANRHARTLLRVPPAGEVRLSDLLEGLGRPVGEWVADVAAGRPTTGPQFLRGAGENQDVFVRVALNVAGPAEDPHLLAVLDDVTELKSLEAQFVQSQKMQALGQLAGGVAHDFNNLLTAISGHSDLLLLRHDPGDPEYTDLVQIRQNVNRAAGLVGQLLAFSRKQSMLPETLDLRAVLADITHLLNRLVGERVRLSLDHEPTLRFIRADKRQLEQVVMNLVVNARDAMPDGGAIRIETANHRLEQSKTLGRATVPPGDYVLVKVTDEGTGIPSERLPKIFDPFYTTKKPGEGTGLGLSTVYGIVKQSGGYIFVDSEVGRGSTFTLWFPAHDRAPQPAATAPVPRVVPARTVRASILLVEDEAGVRAFAARALRMRGHTLHEADSGEAALALLTDPALQVDLILTDVILPDADGPTWVREALEDRPDTRVVFMSGYAEDAFPEQKALIAGSAFLPKPFSLTELTTMVEEQLSGGGLQGGKAPGAS
jgi:two-component system cell cycle sensor histidine kinase/response regulator CckA